MHADVYVITKR